MKNILCFGDSNTWGYDASTYDPMLGSGKRMAYNVRWPGAVQNILGADYHIIEDALNGRTILMEDPYFVNHQGASSLEIALDAHAPLDLVILKLGVNELKHFFNLTAGMIAFGMEKLIIQAKTVYYNYPAPKVLLVAPHPVSKNIDQYIFGFSFGSLAYEKSCQLGKLYREIAEKHDCGFVDCAPLNFKLNDLDGMHYDQSDHKKLAPVIAQKIIEMIG